MDNIFFDTSYSTLQQTLIKVGVFVIVSGLLIWLIYFVLTKLLYRKSSQRKEISLKLVFLWAIFTYFILFNIYLFILFYRTGTDSMNFLSGKFYLGILAQLTIFICLIVFFFIKRNSLKKIINGNSIN
jgi:hypothetical protein